jgi:hypothetical protein
VPDIFSIPKNTLINLKIVYPNKGIIRANYIWALKFHEYLSIKLALFLITFLFDIISMTKTYHYSDARSRSQVFGAGTAHLARS